MAKGHHCRRRRRPLPPPPSSPGVAASAEVVRSSEGPESPYPTLAAAWDSGKGTFGVGALRQKGFVDFGGRNEQNKWLVASASGWILIFMLISVWPGIWNCLSLSLSFTLNTSYFTPAQS